MTTGMIPIVTAAFLVGGLMILTDASPPRTRGKASIGKRC
jgi:hypothetical protein